MSIENNEGNTPNSIEEEALAELKKEGFEVGEQESIPDEGNVPEATVEEEEKVETPKVEEPKDEEIAPEEEAPVEDKPDRTPKTVEAWKLKVAEDQKAKAEQAVVDLQKKLDEVSTKDSNIDADQKAEIEDDLKSLAEEHGADPELLAKLQDSLLKKIETKFKPSVDLENALKEIADEKELQKQETIYSNDFDKDVAPLVKEKYKLSESALLNLKDKLKGLAFTETYAKVPLAKIFRAEEEDLGLKVGKKSSEDGSVKIRQNDVVDFDNMSEEAFNNLSPEQVEAFQAGKSSY